MKEVAFIVSVVFLVLIVGDLADAAGYKRGQIDAINGKIHYHLVTQPDNTTKWVRGEKAKND